ncbi:MAG TPA: amidohydrolase family protein [Acidimicrobiales bacterium]
MDRLLFVSADGHSTMPTELWPEYLEKEFHRYLPRLSDENRVFTRAMGVINEPSLIFPTGTDTSPYDVFDAEGHYRSGQWAGAWDLDVRLQEMDREGVAAELVYHGYFKATDLFFNVSNTVYPVDVVDAGVRAHNRWAHDTFGSAADRLLLVSAIGRCLDIDVAIREAAWAADHGFVATYAPGFTPHPDQPPLYDPYWDPLWSFYEESGTTLVVHAGYGFPVGYTYGLVNDAFEHAEANGDSDQALADRLMSQVFNDDKVFSDLRCRRPLWQMMLGGVFDRHPDLRLLMTEVRADWVPALLGRLDALYDANRDDLPALRRPSEYWHSNCMAGLSFMHRSEVEMRDEIGIDTLSFGRDYPHTESTWPNTADYLRALFEGVPEAEVRPILGENLARFLRLDRAALQPVVDRIGFAVDDILGWSPPVSPDLIAHLNMRCGYSKPAEEERRLADLEPMIHEDLIPLTSG